MPKLGAPLGGMSAHRDANQIVFDVARKIVGTLSTSGEFEILKGPERMSLQLLDPTSSLAGMLVQDSVELLPLPALEAFMALTPGANSFVQVAGGPERKWPFAQPADTTP